MLKIYQEIQPNQNGIHYFFSNFENYLEELSPYLIKEVDKKNYRINSNVLLLKIDNILTLEKINKISYIIDYELSYYRCYNVVSIIEQSGYFQIDLQLDDWANNIAVANFSNIIINKCNRNIGIGMYDRSASTKTYEENYFDIGTNAVDNYPLFLKFENCAIVFSLKYNVKQTAFGANTATELLAFDIKYLRDLVIAKFPERVADPVLPLAIAIVAGIYGTEASGITGTNDAQVTGAWLCDKTALVYTDRGITLKSLSTYGDITNLSPLAISQLEVTKNFTLKIDPNFVYYVGTKNKGLKLNRTSENELNVTFNWISKQDSMQLLVFQGDNMEDITDQIQVNLTLNDGDVTGIRSIASYIIGIAGSTAGVVGAGAAGNIPRAFSGTANLANAIIDPLSNRYLGKQINGGDGVTTFFKLGNAEAGLGVANPYCFVKCQSINNEAKEARINGLTFDLAIENFDEVFVADFINNSVATETFIKATCNIENLQLSPANSIIQKLARGIYVKKI